MSVLQSLTNCKVLSTIAQEDDLEGWLKARSRGIGGSDVGAICGVNNYSTPRLVYLKKTGQYEEEFSDASKERMEWGHILEPVVADKFQAVTGKKVVKSPATLQHIDHPWALANIDRFIVDEHGAPYGVLEVKTAGEFMNEDWKEGELPLSYVYQLTWYLIVTGLKYGAFACLVGGNKFYYYEVFLNEDLAGELFTTAERFWNYHVKGLNEPELTGKDADSDYIKTKYADLVKGSSTTLPEDADNLAAFVADGRKELKDLEKQVEEAANKLKDLLKDTEIGHTMNYKVTWSPASQTRVDMDKLKQDFPHVYEQCKKTLKYRILKVKYVE